MTYEPISLRIHELEMREFRGFEYGKVKFIDNYQTSVFVGVNGSGKSTILDCITIMISWVEARLRRSLFDWSPKDGLFPTSDDVRIGSKSSEIGIKAEFRGRKYPQFNIRYFRDGGGTLTN